MWQSSKQKLVHSPTTKNPLLVFSFLRISYFNSPSCRGKSFLLKALWTWAMRSAVFNGSSLNPSPSIPLLFTWPDLSDSREPDTYSLSLWARVCLFLLTFKPVKMYFFFVSYNSRTWVFLNRGKQEACLSIVASYPTIVFSACRLFPRPSLATWDWIKESFQESGAAAGGHAYTHLLLRTITQHQTLTGVSDSTFFLNMSTAYYYTEACIIILKSPRASDWCHSAL